MRKQLFRFCGGKRSTQHLPAVSEEANDAPLQNTAVQAEESREEIIQPLFARTTNLLFQTEKQKDINEAKVLFPDFFPAQGALQGTWEAKSPWKARPSMEQIFSGQNNLDLPVKSGLRYDTNFEYWKRYQLSF